MGMKTLEEAYRQVFARQGERPKLVLFIESFEELGSQVFSDFASTILSYLSSNEESNTSIPFHMILSSQSKQLASNLIAKHLFSQLNIQVFQVETSNDVFQRFIETVNLKFFITLHSNSKLDFKVHYKQRNTEPQLSSFPA